MLTADQIMQRERLTAMARMLEAATAAAMDALIHEAEACDCFVTGPPDEFGDPSYNLAEDLRRTRMKVMHQVGGVMGAITEWTGDAPDAGGEYGG